MKRVCIAALILAAPLAHAWSQSDPLTPLLQALDNVPLHQRVVVVKKIGDLGRRAKDAIPILENLLHETNEELGNQAARSLAQIGPDAVPLLIEGAKNANPRVSLRSLWALSLIGPEAERALPVLVELLDHEQERNRAGALFVLGEIGPAARETTEQIVKSIRTKSLLVRYNAVLALGKIGTVAVPQLRLLLKDEDDEVRADAALALSLYGKLAKPALADLAAALKDKTEEVRAKAAYAIGAMEKDGNDALPHLVDVLQDPEYEVQVAAFQAAVQVGVGDPRLMEALRIANQKGKWATPFILKQFGKNPGDAVQPLIKKLKTREGMEQIGAAWALGQLGLQARDAVPELQKLLKEAPPQLRMVALQALKQIDQEIRIDENPILREWNLALEKRVEAMNQFQVKHLRLAPEKRLTPFQLSLQNPQVQQHYGGLAQMYVSMSVTRGPRVPGLERLFDGAGPEAIPALVQAVNMVASLNFGFT